MIDLQSTAVSSNLTVEEASEFKRNVFNAQVMLTNLGFQVFHASGSAALGDSAVSSTLISEFMAPKGYVQSVRE